MEKFSQFRHVAEAAKESGLDKSERRELFEGGDDYINEIIVNSHPENIQKTTDGQYYSGEKVYNIDKFFDFMEGSREGDQPALGLGAVLRKYGSKEKRSSRERLTADEGRLVTIAVKYFEDWFYRGTYLKEFEQPNDRENYHAVSAFIVNQLAKIKEVSENNELVEGFDSQRLTQLIEKVAIFAEEYLTEDNLKSKADEIAAAKKQLEDELLPLKAKAAPFERKIHEIESEFKDEFNKILESVKNSQFSEKFDFREKEAFRRLSDVLERYNKYNHSHGHTELQRIMLGKRGSLLDALKERISDRMQFEVEDDKISFQNDLKQVINIEGILKSCPQRIESNKKSASKEKPQKLSGFAALAEIKESVGENEVVKMLEGIVGDPYEKTRSAIKNQYKLKDAALNGVSIYSKEYAIDDLKWELQAARDVFFDREKIKQTLKSSMESVAESLKRPAGDLYLLKTILIAAAEQANRNRNKKFRKFSPDASITSASRKDVVFSFHGSSRWSGNEGYGDYSKVHFEPAHLPFAQFIVEYMRNEKLKNEKEVN